MFLVGNGYVIRHQAVAAGHIDSLRFYLAKANYCDRIRFRDQVVNSIKRPKLGNNGSLMKTIQRLHLLCAANQSCLASGATVLFKDVLKEHSSSSNEIHAAYWQAVLFARDAGESLSHSSCLRAGTISQIKSMLAVQLPAMLAMALN